MRALHVETADDAQQAIDIVRVVGSAELPTSVVSPSKRLEPARVVLLRDFLAAKLSSLRWRD